MKKLAILLSMILVIMAMAGLASAEKPGEQVVVPINLSSDNIGYIEVTVNDGSWYTVNKVTAVGGAASGNSFNVAGLPVGTGTIGNVTITINADCPPGTYSLSFTPGECYDINEEKASPSLSSGKVEVVDPYCENCTWGDSYIDKEPTCTVDGVRISECTVCGKKAPTVIPATGHTAGTPVDEKAATCVDDGLRVTYCATCDEKMSEEAIPALGHDEKVVAGKPATCKETGLTDGKICQRCQEVLAEQTVIEKLAHTEAVVAAVAPTCKETGLTEGKKCSVCDEVLVAQETVPVIDHDQKIEKTDAASCTAPGIKKYYCSMCNELQKEETLDSVGHTSVVDPAVAPTCTEAGKTEGAHCSVCNEVLTPQEEVPALGHTEVVVPAVEATCTADGLTEGKKCSVCGVVTVEQETVPAAHKPSEDAVRVEPTCEVPGSISYKCAVCGEDVESEEIPALGHAWDEGVKTEPTCTEDGKIDYTCTNDATHTKSEPVAKLGHDWGEWTVTKPVEDEVDGEEARTCARCGEVETRVISARVTFRMTVCSEGIRFRDLENPVTGYWYMFTPVDLSVDGVQEFDLIAGNIHRVGKVYVEVLEGNVTVTYKLYNKNAVDLYEEFLTILPSLEGITELDFDALTNYAFGEAISIEEDLAGDTKVLLLLRNRATYKEGIEGIYYFDFDGDEYNAYAEELKQLMD